MEYDYDLFVIGAGSGRVRLSRIAASYGARCDAEDKPRRGTCVLARLYSKKTARLCIDFRMTWKYSGYGWSYAPGSFSWPTLIEGKNRRLRG